MAHHPEIIREAREQYREAVRVFNEKEEAKKKSLLEQSPRLQETAAELDRLSLRMAHAALMGLPTEIPKIRQQAEEIHQKQGDILEEMGENRDALRPHYMCPLCEDSGSTGKGNCSCLMSVYTERMLKRYQMYLGNAELGNLQMDLFSTAFGANGVSPRILIDYAADICRRYAEEFCEGQADGLFIYGACGVGKSFLAAGTVRRIIERGYYVHCISATELFSIYERSRFGRCEASEKAMLDACFEADLLFLDDLGSEVASAHNAPFLARLLNERINRQKGTILVAQCMDADELARRYSAQIRSRVKGSFTEMMILGNDLRNTAK